MNGHETPKSEPASAATKPSPPAKAAATVLVATEKVTEKVTAKKKVVAATTPSSVRKVLDKELAHAKMPDAKTAKAPAATTPSRPAAAAADVVDTEKVTVKKKAAAAPTLSSVRKALDKELGDAVEVVMPLPMDEHMTSAGKPKAGYAPTAFSGPLFSSPLGGNEPTPLCTDVHQGDVGNCYFAAALALLAAFDPQAIRRAVAERAAGDGRSKPRTFDVTFATYFKSRKMQRMAEVF